MGKKKKGKKGISVKKDPVSKNHLGKRIGPKKGIFKQKKGIQAK